MAKKVIVFLLCVFFSVLSCACTQISEISSNEPPSESIIEYCFLIEESEKNLISIKFPIDYDFNEKQNKFFSDFVSIKLYEISGEKFELSSSKTKAKDDQNYTDYYIDIEAKTSYVSEDMVSIVFTGLFNKKSAAHPRHLFFALNFDPKTMDTVEFSSIHIIDDKLYNEFAKQGEKEILEESDGVWPDGWGSFSETLCSKENFFDGLNNKNSDIEWYYTNDNIGFSYSVPFALGDHKEVEIDKDYVSSRISNGDENFVGEFKTADYQWEISEFASNKVLSKIENTEDLIDKAKKLWLDDLEFQMNEEYVIRVYYDLENDNWMVCAEIDDIETDYAAPGVIIARNGKVIAIFRG